MASKTRRQAHKKNNRGLVMVLGGLAILAFVGGWLWAGPGAGESGSGAGAGAQVVVYQNPACGCCGKWIAHLKRDGFDVEVHKTNEVNRVKEREGITAATAACHTALVDGYVVEGHVPARDIERLLRERPDIKGLTVPGMPAGSPGMEGGRSEPYDVLAIAHDGSTSVYASH